MVAATSKDSSGRCADSSAANVRVAVRLRPISARERLAGASEVLLCNAELRQIIAGSEHCFGYDSVFGTDSLQQDLFVDLAQPTLNAFIEGFNCTILAYGQTGSGKTFTMGTGLDGNLDESTQGLIPRSVSYLMEVLGQTYGNPSPVNAAVPAPASAPFYEIYTSFLELYNEEVNDLLAPGSTAATSTSSRKKTPGFTIREDARGEIYLTGIREERIVNGEEIFALLQKGSLSRTTKSTEMNLVSSRSHAIFSLLLRQRRSEGSAILASKLHFVDLAGSERLKRTQARGERVKESISINSGLLALGNVISALGDPTRRATHIPYRDSKLTRLLQDSLGGNSRTLMIACASPSSDNFVESLNTLKYAARAKNIQNRIHLNEETGGPGAFEVSQLKKQIAALKQEILQLRTSRRSGPVDDGSDGGSGLGGSGSGMASGGSAASGPSGAGAELSRLRVQTAEFKRRLTQLTKEKAAVEAERDFFKSCAGPDAAGISKANQAQIKLISELKARIYELENSQGNSGKSLSGPVQSSNASAGSSSGASGANPQTPVWLRQANLLLNRARDEIQENLTTIRAIELSNLQPENRMIDDVDMHDEAEKNPFATGTILGSNSTPSKSSSASALPLGGVATGASSSSIHSLSSSSGVFQLTQAQFAASVATRCESLLSRVRSDLSIKEDLIRQFEICQAEYTSMRRNYDEKLRLVHEGLSVAQKERDFAIKKFVGANGGGAAVVSQAPTARLQTVKYEERIKSLGKELNETRARLRAAENTLQNRSSHVDGTVKQLKGQLDALKGEKSKLQGRLEEEMARLKSDCFAHDSEIRELRQREYRATESVRKLKKAFDFQKALLQKRLEQYHQARIKIRQLMLALRKRGVPQQPFASTESLTADIEGLEPNMADDEGDNAASDLPTDCDDDEVMLSLQLNAQTEAILNDASVEDVHMMDIDISDASSPHRHKHLPPKLEISSVNAQTSEVPLSALRHSPLIPPRRRSDFFPRLNDEGESELGEKKK